MTDHEALLGKTLRQSLEDSRAEGRTQGIEIGHARGLNRGIQLGMAVGVMRVLEMRGIELTSEQRGRIVSCLNMDVMNRRLKRALVVADAEAVFDTGPNDAEAAFDLGL
ncbi:hypothetical protein [Streptodolium elevatio]|uniref:Transposase n=1 Tax=Streptodolium elevatio TaxID=3157996 RepID=A0ABV3DS31_9ACTN